MADYNSTFTGAQIDAGITSANSAVQPGDDASTLGSGAAADGLVLTSDGLGGTAWEAGGGSPAGSSGQFQFNNGGIFAAADLWQATNLIEQRNGTNAQTFNLYNTYTDALNYERGFMKWNANNLEIGTEAAGTGVGREIRLLAGSGTQQRLQIGTNGIFFGNTSIYFWYFNTSGHFLPITNNLRDFGTTSNRAKTIYAATSVESPRVEVDGNFTVSTLPTPSVGMIARVTDANAPSIGSTVTGGGAANALCWYNGTNWTVIGV